jgi:1-acyl-sn-glycerol-3-phosphate acyltransferase
MAVSHRWAQRFSEQRSALWAQRLLRLARCYTGASVNFATDPGLELPPQGLILANHQSLIDIAAIMAYFYPRKVRFVAKKELRRGFPGVSAVLRVERHALIDRRGNFSEGMEKLKRLGRAAKRGRCPVIFPEGTRSRDGRLRAFSPGAVRIVALQHPQPCIAVAVDGGYKLATFGDLIKARDPLYRLEVVGVYPPPKTKEDVRHVVSRAHDDIAARLDAWHTTGRSASAQTREGTPDAQRV